MISLNSVYVSQNLINYYSYLTENVIVINLPIALVSNVVYTLMFEKVTFPFS